MIGVCGRRSSSGCDAYTCVSIDLPGHGDSLAAETYDLEAVDRRIHELVERLEFANPIMIGHSIGGIITSMYAGGDARAIARP